MAEERVTRVGVFARLNGGEQLRSTRAGVLVRINQTVLRTTQAGALVRMSPTAVQATTVGVLVRITPVYETVVLAGPGDYTGEASASNPSSSAASTSPGNTAVNELTASASNPSSSAASTSPGNTAVNELTAAASNPSSSAASTSPGNTAVNELTAAASNPSSSAASTSPGNTAVNELTAAASNPSSGAASTSPGNTAVNELTAAASNPSSGAASTSPGNTAVNELTAAASNPSSSAASTSPTMKAAQTLSAAPSGAGGGNPKRLTPTAARGRQLTGAPGGVQIPDEGGQDGGAAWAPGPAPSTAAGVMDRTGAFSVELYDTAGVRVLAPDLTFAPAVFSATAVGGADQAAVAVTGAFPALWSALGWLAYSVHIKNPLGRVVWEGVVEEVSVTLPAYTIGLSLREMYNRVQVQYTRTMDADQDAESLATDWAQDAVSIARYGAKEIKASLNDGSLVQAEALRSTILATVAEPQQIVSIAEGGENGAQLRLVGRWLLLEWEYYSNDTGYVSYEAENTYKEMIGFALTGSGIGFKDDGIHDLGMALSVLETGASVTISGSVSNNRTVRIDSAPNTTLDDQVTYTGTNVGFDPADDIFLPAPEAFDVGEMLDVAGSTLNDGAYWIKRVVDGDRLEVSEGPIVAEAAGATVTLTQGHHAIASDVTFTVEKPGATVTLASYTKIAQKFVASGAWDAQDILMVAARTGAPSDELKFGLYSDTAGAPGTLLGSGTVTGDFVGESLNLVECSLAAPVAVAAGTSYWIVAERTGAADDEAFWHIGVSDELVSTFVAKVWTGAAWIDHPNGVDCPLKVWATVDSATKAGMVAAASAWVDRVEVRSLTGVRVRLFSDGSKRIAEEIQALIDAGNDDAARLLAWFDGSAFVVDVQAADDGALALAADGRFVLLPQQEMEAGVLPVRRWVRILDLPPGAIFEKMSPFYIETATYDVQKLALAVESRGNLSVWDLGL